MSPTCRRAAALTSGDHPEPDPDLSPPDVPWSPRARLRDLRPCVRRPFGPDRPDPQGESQGRRCGDGAGAGWPQSSPLLSERETGGVSPHDHASEGAST